MENCGFVKEVDFVSSYVKLNEFVLPEKIKKAIEITKKRKSLRVMSFKSKREIYEWKDRLRDAYNKSFVNNWEYYPLSDRELKFVIDNAISFVIPDILKVILNAEGEAVGFVLPFPDVSAAMQKNKGKLGPIEIIRLLREIKNTNWLDFNGIGILPEYQGMGGNALLFEALDDAARKNPRFVHSELTKWQRPPCRCARTSLIWACVSTRTTGFTRKNSVSWHTQNAAGRYRAAFCFYFQI